GHAATALEQRLYLVGIRGDQELVPDVEAEVRGLFQIIERAAVSRPPFTAFRMVVSLAIVLQGLELRIDRRQLKQLVARRLRNGSIDDDDRAERGVGKRGERPCLLAEVDTQIVPDVGEYFPLQPLIDVLAGTRVAQLLEVGVQVPLRAPGEGGGRQLRQGGGREGENGNDKA